MNQLNKKTMTKELSDKERGKRFNIEAEQLKFDHHLRAIPKEEIMNNRSSAYKFLDLNKL